ncbi:hypothetical protein Nepgr_003873 [Nepenthes gracilis]|uniref:Uncharacterized protein n=1 Tax=Nepenthes gracilis TaxID=150966 RepID=A0AAD3S0B4_NEPGR|nr:hypothetical protein Nepgr_003873 [Nepenthes gracilis]
MYKATGRLLPLPQSAPGHSTKNPKSSHVLVKENYAAIATSNSFQILHEEDDSSNLGIPVTRIEKSSEVVVMDNLESHDACLPCLEPALPDPTHNNSPAGVPVTNKASHTAQSSQIAQVDIDRHEDMHTDLEMPSSYANAVSSLISSSGTPC